MALLQDLSRLELFDDIENLLFLCERLNNRLNQVTNYVEEVKQIWVNKRQSLESESNVAPTIIQKALKCNKVLLNVAEKLAAIELQTESLYNLNSLNSKNVLVPDEKRIQASQMFANPSIQHHLSNVLTARNSPSNNGPDSQRGTNVSMGRLSNIPNGRILSTTANETVSTRRLSIEKTNSAFHRPIPIQNKPDHQLGRLSPGIRNISQGLQYQVSKDSFNGLNNDYRQQAFNGIDTVVSPLMVDEINANENKTRVKMQVVKPGTIWRRATIPIIDHPSAFFVINQDLRFKEQYVLMSNEINDHYNNPVNTTASLQNISIGDFCVARFSKDKRWYRARIALNNEDSVLIVFIDYGNSEYKSPREIYSLTESFARLPAMIVACTLDQVFPCHENYWTEQAILTFSQIVTGNDVEVHFQHGTNDQQWPLHFVKVLVNGQSIDKHVEFEPYIVQVRNEQIVSHFNDNLTPVEYILYNVAVVESDIYFNNLP